MQTLRVESGAHVGIPLQEIQDWLIVMRRRFGDSVNKFEITTADKPRVPIKLLPCWR
jgi:hypothetical protein